MEIGGWFTGALFAVGGSLWATNLFWRDIPEAFRPVVVGGGLVVFAAAFMALGAVLAQRHRGSLAGHVLGLVGRLIGISSTIPLALLSRDNLPVAIAVDIVAIVVMSGALRFARRRLRGGAQAHPDQANTDTDDDNDKDEAFFVGALLLAMFGPENAVTGVVSITGALLLARAAISARTIDALSGKSTWVADLSAIGAAVAGVAQGVVACRGDIDAPIVSEIGAVAALAVGELCCRLIEQRPGLYVLRLPARWILALWSVGLALSLADHAERAPLLSVAAFGFAAASFNDPSRLGLPRLFEMLRCVALSAAAAALTALLPLSGDVAEATYWLAAVATLWATTTRFRRGETSLGDNVVSAVAFGVMGIIIAAQGELELLYLPSTVGVALLFVSDKRATRSVWWNLATVVAVMLIPMTFFESLAPRELRALLAGSTLGLFTLVTIVAQRLRRPWPLQAATTALLLWVALVAVPACIGAHEHGRALIVASVFAVVLWLAYESSRQLALGVLAGLVGAFAIAAAVIYVDGDLDIGAVTALAGATLLCSLLVFLPNRPALSPVHHTVPQVRVGGRARRHRALALLLATSALVVGGGLTRLPMILVDDAISDRLGTLALWLAAAALAWRHRSQGQIALFAALSVLAGAQCGVVVGDVLGDADNDAIRAVGAAFGASVATFGVAVAAVVARGVPVVVDVWRRLSRRRRPGVGLADALWTVAAILAVIVNLGALLAIAGLPWREGTVALASLFGLIAATSVALFMARSYQGLIVLAQGALALAPVPVLLRSLVAEDELLTLTWALVAVAVCGAGVVGARALYRCADVVRHPVPRFLAAWPRPWTLRRPSVLFAATWAALIGLLGQGLNADGQQDIATRYGPGVVLVAAALVVVALLMWRARRSAAAVGIAAAVITAVAIGVDGVAHAAHWLPRSLGMSQAIAAVAVTALIAVIDRASSRRRLWALGFGLPARERRQVVSGLLWTVPLLAFVATALAVRDAPRAHELAIAIAGIACVLVVVVRPSTMMARVAAVGVVLVGAGGAAGLARVAFGEDLALEASALPLVCLGGMLGALVVQHLSKRALTSPWMRQLHPDAALDDAARAMRHMIEGQALLLLAVVLGVAVSEPHPGQSALLSTWLCMGVIIVVTSRMAIDRESTWPAALGQGMALAIYIDIRRRTPWLDDVGGVDAIAALVGAGVFILVSVASRRQPRGASIGRAAELYAVTLPIIAAGFGDSDGSRAVICLVGGGLYAIMSRTRQKPGYEFASGAALIIATMLALASMGVDETSLYLLPVAFVGTFLGRRHRQSMGVLGRYLALWCHVPLYASAAWSALQSETFVAFAIGVVFVTAGVIYAMVARDRRSLYAAAVAGAVLVVGRLVLLGLDNALLGTLLLAGAGVLLLGGMTVFTIRRDAAADAVKRATRGLSDWD